MSCVENSHRRWSVAIGGFVGVRLALAGEDVTFIARGANLAALRSRGILLHSEDGGTQAIAEVRATDDYAAAGPQDAVILAMKAHQVEAAGPRRAEVIRARHRRDSHAEWNPVLVFPPSSRRTRGHARPQRRPRRGDRRAHSLRGRVIGCVVYPAAELLSAWGHQACRRQSIPGGGARRHDQRAGHARLGMLHRGRPSRPGSHRHPRRDLAETLGQFDLQSHQRADARHTGRHLPICAHARGRGGDDGRGAGRGRQARGHVPRLPGEAHRRRRGRGGTTRPRCCRMWSPAAPWRSMRCWLR